MAEALAVSEASTEYYVGRKYTYADYKSWELKPGERFELIHGAAYAMPAPTISHQRISMLLSGEFYAFLKDKPCEAFAAPVDVRLFYEEDGSDDTVVQPDLVVVCDPKKLGEEGVRGAPDVAVEILSPSNTAVEMERKQKSYREAGMREYWIVDPQDRHVSVYGLAEGKYRARTYGPGETVQSAALPGLAIPLSAVFPV